MGESYFCPVCGGSYSDPGKCHQCGSPLETIGDDERDNADELDESLLEGRGRNHEIMGY